MKSDKAFDQTQFMAESPLLEEVVVTDVAEPVLPESELKQAKQKKLVKILVLAVAVLLITLGIVVLVKLQAKNKSEQTSETEETQLNEVVVGPFNQRLSELEKELKLADPNQEELPFPPIDAEINLEE